MIIKELAKELSNITNRPSHSKLCWLHNTLVRYNYVDVWLWVPIVQTTSYIRVVCTLPEAREAEVLGSNWVRRGDGDEVGRVAGLSSVGIVVVHDADET